MDFEKLNAVAVKLMKHRKAHREREAGSIYDHGQRVMKLVVTLRKEILPENDSMDDILRLAGMFHDIGKGIEPHAAFGAPIMLQAVKGIAADEEAQEAARLIAAHCDRRPDEPVHDVWEKLIQDADLLDHIGTYNIWMDIQYFAHREMSVNEAAAFLKEKAENYAAFHRTQLNFEVSKRIYDDRIGFYLEYVRRFLVESQGEIDRPENVLCAADPKFNRGR